MNKLKRSIITAAEPPPPVMKEEFIGALPERYAGLCEFTVMQTAFIRKRLWTAAALFSLLAVFCVKFSQVIFTKENSYAVAVISASAPFFALFSVCELFSSEEYGMTEIENACRFGKNQLAAARILIIGVLTFAVMTAVTLSAGIFTAIGIGKAAMYILAPYTVSSAASMEILSRIRGKSGVYACTAISAFTGILGTMTMKAPDIAYIAVITAAVIIITANLNKFLKDGEFYGAYN